MHLLQLVCCKGDVMWHLLSWPVKLILIIGGSTFIYLVAVGLAYLGNTIGG